MLRFHQAIHILCSKQVVSIQALFDKPPLRSQKRLINDLEYTISHDIFLQFSNSMTQHIQSLIGRLG